jgi:hypothetical protein
MASKQSMFDCGKWGHVACECLEKCCQHVTHATSITKSQFEKLKNKDIQFE